MRFHLTEEQVLLQQSAEDWLTRNPVYAPRTHGKAPIQRDLWSQFGAMGWLGLLYAERWGGSACGLLEACVLAQSLGRHLVALPFVTSAVVGARLMQTLAGEAQLARWTPGLVNGTERVALAHAEPGNPSPWSPRKLRAQMRGNIWLLDGFKAAVEGADTASLWLVTAQCDDGVQRVFAVTPAIAGVRSDTYVCLHGANASDLSFEGVELPVDAILGDARLGASGAHHKDALKLALAEGLVAACWSAIGVMESLVNRTGAHVRTRKQFGRPLFELQAVQHSIAEMLVDRAEAQAMCELAAARLQLAQEDASMVAAGALAKVLRAGDNISKRAIQLHGAMGVCEELPVAASFRWIEAFAATNGRWHSHANDVGRSQIGSGRYQYSAVLGDAQ